MPTKEMLEFIEKANKVHNNKYSYSDDNEYINKYSVMKIICPKHGEFEKNARDHLYSKTGCNECSKEASRKKKGMSQEEFMKKLKTQRPDLYKTLDYSETIYTTRRTKIKIICKNHEPFFQLPNNHLKGKGCPKCVDKKHSESLTMSQEDYLKKVKAVHEKLKHDYDYSNTKYKNMRSSINVICKKHGEFEQNAGDHSRGYGCPDCSNSKQLTQEEVIERTKKIHKGKYTYDNFKFKSVDKKSIITCPKHGNFPQKVQNHLSGNGCPKCAGQNKTTEELIAEFKEIHGDKYNYSEVKYTKSNKKVDIICKKHNIFKQTPDSHLKGQGCPKCQGYYKTTEEFTEEAIKVHGDKYTYKNVEYKNAITRVKITCKKHGDFKQQPHVHLRGAGCPLCAKVGYSIGQIEWLTYLSLLHKKDIQHFNNGGEFVIKGKPVDGYCKETNEVYEYHGNLFHGCPRTYPPDMINPVNNKTMKKLYEETMKKEQMIKDEGYTLITIWEDQWLEMKKKLVTVQRFLKNKTHPKDLKKKDFKTPLVKNLEKKKVKPTCPICKNTFTTNSSRNKHVKNKVCTKKIVPKKYVCGVCQRVCRDKHDYERHIARKRPCKPPIDIDSLQSKLTKQKTVKEKPKTVKLKIKTKK